MNRVQQLNEIDFDIHMLRNQINKVQTLLDQGTHAAEDVRKAKRAIRRSLRLIALLEKDKKKLK
jgi:hypothetical protein